MGVWVLYSVHSVCVSPSRQRVRSRVGARDIEVITVPHPPVYELLWCHVSVIKPYYRPIDYAHRTTLFHLSLRLRYARYGCRLSFMSLIARARLFSILCSSTSGRAAATALLPTPLL